MGSPVDDALTSIRRGCPFWAPEMRLLRLLPYLEVHGEELRSRLLALPAEERELCGVNLVRVVWR